MSLPKILGDTLKNLFKKPVTLMEPPEKIEPVEDYRGIHRVDYDKCISCSLCAIECPALAITMVPIQVGDKKKRYPKIDYGKCVFCYRCVEVCPVDAYIVSNKKPQEDTKRVMILYSPEEWFKEKTSKSTSS